MKKFYSRHLGKYMGDTVAVPTKTGIYTNQAFAPLQTTKFIEPINDHRRTGSMSATRN
jgi:hypothetical protein